MTQTTSISDTLALAIESAQAGNTILARMHLQEVLAQDPTNLDAWLWLAWCAESPDSAVRSLEHLLTIDPDHELAWKGLIWASEMAEFRLRRTGPATATGRPGTQRGTAGSTSAAGPRGESGGDTRDHRFAAAPKGTRSAGVAGQGFDPEPSDSVLEEDQTPQPLDEAAAMADTLIMSSRVAEKTSAEAAQPEPRGGNHQLQSDAAVSEASGEGRGDGFDKAAEMAGPVETTETDEAAVREETAPTGTQELDGSAEVPSTEVAREASLRSEADAAQSQPRSVGRPGPDAPGAEDNEPVEEWQLPESFEVAPQPQGQGASLSAAEHTDATAGETTRPSDVVAGPSSGLRTPESMLATEDVAERLIEADLRGDEGASAEFVSNVVPLEHADVPTTAPRDGRAADLDDGSAIREHATRQELPTWDPDPYGEAEDFAAEEQQPDRAERRGSDAASAATLERRTPPVEDESAGDGDSHDGTAAAETDVAVTVADGAEPTGPVESAVAGAESADVDVTGPGRVFDPAPVAEPAASTVGEQSAVDQRVAEVVQPESATASSAGVGEVEAEAEQAAAAEDGDRPADASEATDSGPVVLVVDDSATVRKLVSMTLEKHGYRVVTAFDGVAAIKEIAAHNPALILMDINMPRLDGYQLCKLVKKHPATSHIPVLMLSGKDGMFDKLRGKLVGASGYITKPFSPEGLVEVVARELNVAAR